MHIIDIDAHPPVDSADRDAFYRTLSALGITEALGAPLGEGLSERERNLRALSEGLSPSLWGHPDCGDTADRAALLTVDSPWLPQVGPLLFAAEARHAPILLQHETEEDICALAKNYPTLPLIVGGLDSRVSKPARMWELMGELPNLYLNLSGAVWSYNYVMHEWIQRLPTDRILFGTGYPFGNPAAKLAALRWELRDTEETVREAVFGGNAQALLGRVEYEDH